MLEVHQHASLHGFFLLLIVIACTGVELCEVADNGGQGACVDANAALNNHV